MFQKADIVICAASKTEMKTKAARIADISQLIVSYFRLLQDEQLVTELPAHCLIDRSIRRLQ